MNRKTLLALAVIAAVAYFSRWRVSVLAATTPDAQTRAIAAATTAFLNSLNPGQRQSVSFAFTPQKTATAAQFARTGGPGGPGRSRGGPGKEGPGASVDKGGPQRPSEGAGSR